MAKFNSIPGTLNIDAGKVIARKSDDSGWEGKSIPVSPKIINMSGITNSGSVTFNISSAEFNNILQSGCSFRVNDDDEQYSFEVTSISTTSVTVSVKRRQFTGVVVLSITVLGATSMVNAANGTNVQAIFIGS